MKDGFYEEILFDPVQLTNLTRCATYCFKTSLSLTKSPILSIWGFVTQGWCMKICGILLVGFKDNYELTKKNIVLNFHRWTFGNEFTYEIIKLDNLNWILLWGIKVTNNGAVVQCGSARFRVVNTTTMSKLVTTRTEFNPESFVVSRWA